MPRIDWQTAAFTAVLVFSLTVVGVRWHDHANRRQMQDQQYNMGYAAGIREHEYVLQTHVDAINAMRRQIEELRYQRDHADALSDSVDGK